MVAFSRLVAVEIDLSGLPEALQDELRRYLAQQPEQGHRLDKALRLIRSGAVSFVGDNTDDVFVESESRIDDFTEEPVVYRVGNGRCDCHDFEHRGAVCAHRLARRVLFRLRDSESQEEVPTLTIELTPEEQGARWDSWDALVAQL